jgi:hypothetical protein
MDTKTIVRRVFLKNSPHISNADREDVEQEISTLVFAFSFFSVKPAEIRSITGRSAYRYWQKRGWARRAGRWQKMEKTFSEVFIDV